MFLDLQMPELDGFGVVEAVGVDRMPVVVFVTAYDEHALRAFEIHAVDYLLKPFSNDRFANALSHARRQLQRQRAEEFSERLLQLMRTASPRQLDAADEPPSRMMIKAEGRVAFVSPDEINWVEAEGNYARLYLDTGSHVLRETMKGLEVRMGHRFVRIHRCHAINIHRLQELRTGRRRARSGVERRHRATRRAELPRKAGRATETHALMDDGRYPRDDDRSPQRLIGCKVRPVASVPRGG